MVLTDLIDDISTALTAIKTAIIAKQNEILDDYPSQHFTTVGDDVDKYAECISELLVGIEIDFQTIGYKFLPSCLSIGAAKAVEMANDNNISQQAVADTDYASNLLLPKFSWFETYSPAVNTNRIFENLKNLLYIPTFEKSDGLLNNLFNNCSSLKRIESVSSSQTITNTFNMFRNCRALTSCGIDFTELSSVQQAGSMFENCTMLTSLSVEDWDTSACTNMSMMFKGCSGLTSINVSGWDTSACMNMSQMFTGCIGLTSINVSGWDTSACGNMSMMFSGCSGLTSINVSGWDTSACGNMSMMFSGCSGLTSINVSGWDTSACGNMSMMFSGCIGLTSINDITAWDVSKVADMSSMFSNCLVGITTGTTVKVTNFIFKTNCKLNGMFSNVKANGIDITLDLTGWDTTTITTNFGTPFLNCDVNKLIVDGGFFNSSATTITMALKYWTDATTIGQMLTALKNHTKSSNNSWNGQVVILSQQTMAVIDSDQTLSDLADDVSNAGLTLTESTK